MAINRKRGKLHNRPMLRLRCEPLSSGVKTLKKDLVSEQETNEQSRTPFDFSVNGEILVTLLPVNESLPWITSAKFLPHLVPEELMAEGLTVREKSFPIKAIRVEVSF